MKEAIQSEGVHHTVEVDLDVRGSSVLGGASHSCRLGCKGQSSVRGCITQLR